MLEKLWRARGPTRAHAVGTRTSLSAGERPRKALVRLQGDLTKIEAHWGRPHLVWLSKVGVGYARVRLLAPWALGSLMVGVG